MAENTNTGGTAKQSADGNLEASLLAAGATGLEFVGNGNNADLVSLIKEAAIFKYDVDAEDVGTLGPEWKPGSGKQPLGYFSEDGITIHPEAGDDNDFTAHNGDTVVSMTSGGYWTFQFAALEGKKEVIENSLFGVDIQEQAVRLCELRLWLSLVVDYQLDTARPFTDSIRHIPTLPNLSYRIVRGDSLLERQEAEAGRLAEAVKAAAGRIEEIASRIG